MAETEGVFISVTKTTEANWNDLKNEIVVSINAVLEKELHNPKVREI